MFIFIWSQAFAIPCVGWATAGCWSGHGRHQGRIRCVPSPWSKLPPLPSPRRTARDDETPATCCIGHLPTVEALHMLPPSAAYALAQPPALLGGNLQIHITRPYNMRLLGSYQYINISLKFWKQETYQSKCCKGNNKKLSETWAFTQENNMIVYNYRYISNDNNKFNYYLQKW